MWIAASKREQKRDGLFFAGNQRLVGHLELWRATNILGALIFGQLTPVCPGLNWHYTRANFSLWSMPVEFSNFQFCVNNFTSLRYRNQCYNLTLIYSTTTQCVWLHNPLFTRKPDNLTRCYKIYFRFTAPASRPFPCLIYLRWQWTGSLLSTLHIHSDSNNKALRTGQEKRDRKLDQTT